MIQWTFAKSGHTGVYPVMCMYEDVDYCPSKDAWPNEKFQLEEFELHLPMIENEH